MEKITDKIAALPPGSNYFSLEFFPPKTSMGSSNLRARLDRMSRALRPLFVTVTWGAGGSTAEKSLELAELCQRELGLTTCLHLTCTNMSKKLVDKALQDAKVLGVRNILALRGDPPRSEEYKERINGHATEEMADDDEFEWAIDLVKYIRKTHGDYFCIGVAAYPEGHADEGHPEGQSLEHDLPYLVGKTQAGADFIMTQLFFDVEAFDKFEKRLREHESGAFKTIPIIPGMMPIQSYQMIKRTTKLSHARLPPNILSRLDEVKGDDEKVKKVGVDIVAEIVTHIKEKPAPSPRGFHFYTLNLEKAVSFILERTNLIPPEDDDEESAILEVSVPLSSLSVNGTNGSPSKRASRRESSGSYPHNKVIVSRPISNSDWETSAIEAAIPANAINSRANTLAISEGEGALGREATWDDFPNGRWGDARSPAYGEIDGYGVSLHMSINQAIKSWGFPKSAKDITELFIKHIEGQLSAIPWSEEGLNEETNTIKSQLLQLNQKGWWSVASQPAVNGVKSTDSVFGWGPQNGFVFQKAFVELFLPSKDWILLKEKLTNDENEEVVSWYAANAKGDYLTSDSITANGVGARGGEEVGSTNAVTWGAFPGKEIITPTIIEEVSFRAWAEEAFGIWEEWGRVYERESESKKLIEGIREDYWLVNIIHHGYVEREGLWDLLLK